MKASTEIGFLDQPQSVHGTMRFCSGTDEGIKDCSVWQSTGNNTNTHISTSKMLFRTFQGFCYLLSCCYRIGSSSVANIFYCPLICCSWGMSRQWRDIFITWESNLFDVIDEKSLKLGSLTQNDKWADHSHHTCSVALCFLAHAMLLWKLEITCK